MPTDDRRAAGGPGDDQAARYGCEGHRRPRDRTAEDLRQSHDMGSGPRTRLSGGATARQFRLCYSPGMGTVKRPRSAKYGSAHDLPSVQEMQQSIYGLSILTRFVARDQRPKLIETERQIRRLADLVDRFYDRLGSRNWIFHDTLDVSRVEEILDETDTPADAEERLVELYRDRDALKWKLLRLRSVNGLRERFHQIERARDHYDSGQFDSCVLHLIAVMDGFVSDFEPRERKGLASREPDDMVAWDSMVGHHMGLTNALTTFTKTIKKREDSEVFEIYRHGIMHGSIVKFNNVIVATKAWNMLFAVVDWAEATTRANAPVQRKPTFGETLQQLAENRRVRRELDAWRPTSYTRGDDGFQDHQLLRLTNTFLKAWRNSNFGALAALASRRIGRQKTRSKLAGELREVFDFCNLTEFEVDELEHRAPAIWLTRGTAVMNGRRGTFECRWLLEDADGSSGFASDAAEWRLVFCDPSVWRSGESGDDGPTSENGRARTIGAGLGRTGLGGRR